MRNGTPWRGPLGASPAGTSRAPMRAMQDCCRTAPRRARYLAFAVVLALAIAAALFGPVETDRPATTSAPRVVAGTVTP